MNHLEEAEKTKLEATNTGLMEFLHLQICVLAVISVKIEDRG